MSRPLIYLLLTLLSGCASTLHIPAYHSTQSSTTAPADELTIEYLGVGGHLMKYGDAVLLTAPSFTNPHFLRVGPFMPIHTDKARVDQFLPDVSDAEMVLVGHAHYDHLMDVPYVMQAHATRAHVYGSQTMANSIRSAISADRIHVLNDRMGNATQPGEWIYSESRRIRIMALESSHAPHFMGIKLMQGQYDEARDSLPWHAFAWKEGQTMAYLIDFLDASGQPAYRIFYQDSASQEPKGLVPPLADNKAIDIAILCPASFAQVDNYPESVMQNTRAKHFILGHWEDFFANNPGGQQQFVRATSQDDFMQRFNAALPAGSTWVLPELFSIQRFHQGGELIP